MKILAVIGSGRKKGNSYLCAKRMEEKLRQLDPDIDFAYLFISDVDIAPCIGCRACFDAGEGRCPHKDDIPALAQKLLAADAVIFASPTYVCSMSGLLKNMLDRMAYFCHRPAFHGKAAAVVTTTGSASAKMAAYTIRLPLGSMGFTVTGSLAVTLHTGDVVPVSEKTREKLDRLALKLYRQAASPNRNAPTVFGLVSFYANRRHYARVTAPTYDFQYFEQKGWLAPDRAFYTDEKPTLLQKMAARFILLFLKST